MLPPLLDVENDSTKLFLSKVILGDVKVIFPAVPMPIELTDMPLRTELFIPEIRVSFSATISIFPAIPVPDVEAVNREAPSKATDFDLISILPPLPSASLLTLLLMLLKSANKISLLVTTFIFPASPLPEVEVSI